MTTLQDTLQSAFGLTEEQAAALISEMGNRSTEDITDSAKNKYHYNNEDHIRKMRLSSFLRTFKEGEFLVKIRGTEVVRVVNGLVEGAEVSLKKPILAAYKLLEVQEVKQKKARPSRAKKVVENSSEEVAVEAVEEPIQDQVMEVISE